MQGKFNIVGWRDRSVDLGGAGRRASFRDEFQPSPSHVLTATSKYPPDEYSKE